MFGVCSLPICLYGCENWLLTDQLLKSLEDFQLVREFKTIAKTSCQYLCVGCFGVADHAFTYSQSTIQIKQLRCFQFIRRSGARSSHTSFLEQILLLTVCLKYVKKGGSGPRVHKADQDYIWSKVKSHTSLALLPRSVLWCKLWDKAKDHGLQGTHSLQVILRTVTIIPSRIDQPCPICDFVHLKVLQPPTTYYHTSLVVLSIYCRY